MLSGRTHNGGFQERIICYILYKDDDYIAFLFRNKSILILILLRTDVKTSVHPTQQCPSEIRDSNRCRMYREIKLSLLAPSYIELSICKHLRVYYIKLRLSSHKLLVERGRWIKSKVPYNERRCTLCNNPDIQDEFYITLCCAKFTSLRVKYIKP